MDTELDQVAREDQDKFEMEYCCGEENDLPELKRTCKKNPKHTKFIAVKDFEGNHLPEQYRDPLVADCVKAKANITVRIVVPYTSSARPAGYVCHKLAGKRVNRYGSGWLECALDNGSGHCPCRQCAQTTCPVKKWGQVMIHTAKHVIYDREEAQEATFDLFYDGSEEDQIAMRSLMGWRVQASSAERDHSLVACITHDMELLKKLKAMTDAFQNIYSEIVSKYGSSSYKDRLTCIVSHPHGCSKQVTIGEWIERFQCFNEYHTRYTYTTSTCPGSSGAPVFVLGRIGWWVNGHPHSGQSETDGLNTSGGGVDY